MWRSNEAAFIHTFMHTYVLHRGLQSRASLGLWEVQTHSWANGSQLGLINTHTHIHTGRQTKPRPVLGLNTSRLCLFTQSALTDFSICPLYPVLCLLSSRSHSLPSLTNKFLHIFDRTQRVFSPQLLQLKKLMFASKVSELVTEVGKNGDRHQEPKIAEII